MAHFEILKEVHIRWEEGWNLCFQWGKYHYKLNENRDPQKGYRFIWRRPDGSQQARPARIPKTTNIFELLKKATSAGWFISVEKERDDL